MQLTNKQTNIMTETNAQVQVQVQTRTTPQIYRYQFTESFMVELYNFSKIHQYDDRKEFKSAWNSWAEEHAELIQDETRRLNNLNYDGDVNEKMFHSARYYFRKKLPEKKEQSERKRYICVDRDLINAMDAHILKKCNKPSTAFLEFCKENLDLLSEEIARLYSENITADDIKKKIKKTYKNRYFLKMNPVPVPLPLPLPVPDI